MSSESTKIKVATEEIKEILRKHDLAGAIGIHTPGQAYMFLHFNTSYSCAYIYDEKHMRIYSKSSDYATEEEHFQKVKSTSNMFKMLLDASSLLVVALQKYSSTLDGIVHATHGKGTFKPE